MATPHIDDSAYQAVVKKTGLNKETLMVALDSVNAPKAVSKFSKTSPNSSSGNFNGQSIVVFDLQSDTVHIPEFYLLALRTQESGGSNTVSPLVGPYMIDRMELRAAGTLSTIVPFQLYCEYLLDNDTEWQTTMEDNINISASTFDANVNIAPSASQTFYLPFTFFTCNSVFMPAVLTKLQIWVYLSQNPWETGGGSLSIQDSSLITYGKTYSSKIRDALLARHRSIDHVCKSVDRRDASDTIGVLTSNVATQKQLSTFTGTFSNLRFAIRESSAVRGNLINYQPISTLDILDSSGTPLNYSQVDAELLKSVFKAEKNYPSLSSTQKAIYDYPLSCNPFETETEGKHTGGMVLNGRYQVKLTPGVLDNSGTSHDLLAYGNQYVELVVKKSGELVVNYI